MPFPLCPARRRRQPTYLDLVWRLQTTVRGPLLVNQGETGVNGHELKAAFFRKTRPLGPPPSRLGLHCSLPWSDPSGLREGPRTDGSARPGLARSPQDLGVSFSSARTVSYLLAGLLAACAPSWPGCASRGSGGRGVPRRGSRKSRQQPAESSAGPPRHGEPSLGLPGEGRLTVLSRSESGQVGGEMRLNCWGRGGGG